MNVPIDETTVGLWLVKADNGIWLAVLSKTEDGFFLQTYFNGERKEATKIKDMTQHVVVSRLRRGVTRVMEDTDTDRGWEAIRGERSLEEFRRLIGSLQRISG